MDIKIINPNDVNAILIQKDRDLVTLLTCHLCGSGGLYRYLVRTLASRTRAYIRKLPEYAAYAEGGIV